MGRNDQADRKFFEKHAGEVAGIAERARAAGDQDKAAQADASVQLAQQQIRKIDARH